MYKPKPNRSLPECTVIPELAYENVIEASQWLCRAFGFTERLRIGQHRVQLRIGEGAIILIERPPSHQLNSPQHPGSPPPPQANAKGEAKVDKNEITHAVLVRVAEVDPHYEQARQQGAEIVQVPTDYPYGERQYVTLDLAGHRWIFSQSIADVDPLEWGATLPTA